MNIRYFFFTSFFLTAAASADPFQADYKGDYSSLIGCLSALESFGTTDGFAEHYLHRGPALIDQRGQSVEVYTPKGKFTISGTTCNYVASDENLTGRLGEILSSAAGDGQSLRGEGQNLARTTEEAKRIVSDCIKVDDERVKAAVAKVMRNYALIESKDGGIYHTK